MSVPGKALQLALIVMIGVGLGACSAAPADSSAIDASTATTEEETGLPDEHDKDRAGKLELSEAEWREKLSPEEFAVLRDKGTEPRGTGRYDHTTTAGIYRCAACGQRLFESEEKFASGCGWPAFSLPFEKGSVVEHRDTSHGMVRIEVVCSRCESHLGHVFDDGPGPAGLRYCINSVCLKLDESKN